MAWETFPYSYTSPYTHLWIVETLQVIIFWVWVLTHPTPTWHTPTYPTPSWPHPPHPYMTHPTPPHPTPSWPTHPTLPHPTPPNPFMTHPPHPIPPHPTPSWPTHPTPPCNHKIRVQECYGGRAMSCPWHVGGWRHWGPFSVDMQPYGCFISWIFGHIKNPGKSA